jgi:S1-C subfamily serine protease
VIDLLILALLLSYAVSGYRQGIAVGGLSLLGFLVVAVLAMWLVPIALAPLGDGTGHTVILLFAVLGLAWLGQYAGAVAGTRIRNRLKLPLLTRADHALGSLAGVVSVSLVLWFIAGAIRDTSIPWLPRAIGSSRVLGVVDGLVPPSVAGVAARFRQAVSDSGFPRVFEGVGPEQILPVSPPTPGLMPAPVQAAIQRSVVKVLGEAPACRRGQEGTGWVLAPHRVVTNAHVVAGVDHPQVLLGRLGNGQRHQARVVLFDPEVDIAVLDVPDLDAAPLDQGDTLDRSADTVVVGYPRNGPFTLVPARVRSVIRASGEDIYGRPGVTRQVYSLFTRVEQGNSGGPLLDPRGRVVGVVFAKSLDDPQTGYALTLNTVGPDLAAGERAGDTVDTGGCAAG